MPDFVGETICHQTRATASIKDPLSGKIGKKRKGCGPRGITEPSPFRIIRLRKLGISNGHVLDHGPGRNPPIIKHAVDKRYDWTGISETQARSERACPDEGTWD